MTEEMNDENLKKINFDPDVEDWINELLDNGTFETRKDILEFCVYATKTFGEANNLRYDDKKMKKAKEQGRVPIKLEKWKEWLDDNKDVVNLLPEEQVEEHDGKMDFLTIDNPEDREPVVVHDVPFVVDDKNVLVDVEDPIEQQEKGNYDYIEYTDSTVDCEECGSEMAVYISNVDGNKVVDSPDGNICWDCYALKEGE